MSKKAILCAFVAELMFSHGHTKKAMQACRRSKTNCNSFNNDLFTIHVDEIKQSPLAIEIPQRTTADVFLQEVIEYVFTLYCNRDMLMLGRSEIQRGWGVKMNHKTEARV
jgi:hypothetical protein